MVAAEVLPAVIGSSPDSARIEVRRRIIQVKLRVKRQQ